MATRDDIVGILDLQEQNLLAQGGLLSVQLPSASTFHGLNSDSRVLRTLGSLPFAACGLHPCATAELTS